MKTRMIVVTLMALILSGGRIVAAGEEATEKLLKSESLGGLRLDLLEKEVIKLLGEPAKRGEVTLQEADGNYVQDWDFPEKGIEISMSAGETKTGPKKIFSFTASVPCKLATKAGITIGSAESAVREAYAGQVDRDTPASPESFIVGSIYGGIIFNLEDGKVSRIFFGAAAE